MKEEDQEGKAEEVEEPRTGPIEGAGFEEDKEHSILAVEAPGAMKESPDSDAAGRPEPETAGDPEPEEGQEGGVEEGLELDRMEVKPAEEVPEEPVEEAEAVIIEPKAPEEEDVKGPKLIDLLAAHWIWIAAFLLGLAVVSAALLYLLAPEAEQPEEAKLGKRVHVIDASLGGEHYVRFNLWGPFRDARGQAALERGLPKVKHDLILTGGRPEVVRSIQENDLYFLEKYILEIVSNATGIPVGRLDLKGLSVSRYSDEAEVEE
jgi:hypothetical protein